MDLIKYLLLYLKIFERTNIFLLFIIKFMNCVIYYNSICINIIISLASTK